MKTIKDCLNKKVKVYSVFELFIIKALYVLCKNVNSFF